MREQYERAYQLMRLKHNCIGLQRLSHHAVGAAYKSYQWEKCEITAMRFVDRYSRITYDEQTGKYIQREGVWASPERLFAAMKGAKDLET